MSDIGQSLDYPQGLRCQGRRALDGRLVERFQLAKPESRAVAQPVSVVGVGTIGGQQFESWCQSVLRPLFGLMARLGFELEGVV